MIDPALEGASSASGASVMDPAISLLLAVAFAVLFGSAAAIKLRSPSIFIATLEDYRLIPRVLLRPVAALVIAIEGAVALGLFWPATRDLSAVVGAGVLVVYGASIAINLLRGRHEIDCGCSLQRRPIGLWMVVRNALFACAMSALTLPVSARALGVGDVATIAAGVFILVLLYASLDLLLARGRHSSLEHS